MSVDVRLASADDLDSWNDYVARSPQGTRWHEYEALAVQADHADATLHPLVGFKGQEPVGLFPVFEIRKRLVTTAFSPPPRLRVPYLGPAFLNMAKLKQRKRERRRRRFLEGCFDWIRTELSPKYVHVRTAPGLTDTRAFAWNDYDVTPEYTYEVALEPGESALLDRFSSDARRNVTNTPADAYEVGVGGADDAERILEQVRGRYEAQGVGFDVPTAFVQDLYEETPDGAVRPYTLEVDDEFVGGILAVQHGDTIGRWLGGVRVDADVDLPTNDLLDWAVIRDGIEDGLATYDLVGAGTPRINSYKAKFDPDLRTYYSAEYGKWGMDTVAHLYDTVK